MKEFVGKHVHAFRFSSRRRKAAIGLTIGLIAAGATAAVYAAQINVPVIELTASVAAPPDCFQDSVIDVQSQFSPDASSNSYLYVSQISISGVSADCAGNYARLQLLDVNNLVLQEVVWQMETDVGVTSLTLIADGSTTSSSNSTSGTVRTNYPASQTDPNGLALNETTPDSISEFGLAASTSSLPETT